MQVFECQFSRPFNFLCQRHTLTPLEEGEREGRKTNSAVPRLGHRRWLALGCRGKQAAPVSGFARVERPHQEQLARTRRSTLRTGKVSS